jgi:hypothetical protein
MKRIATTTTVLTLTSTAAAFTQTQQRSFMPSSTRSPNQLPLQMGLFDGMKDAFSAPPTTSVGSERETPIDRWMGWNVEKQEETKVASTPSNFVDSMDEKNYVSCMLQKPMGIVFEENDEEFGGIFVISLSEDGAAEAEGTAKPGDQLIAVNDQKVSGLTFDAALGYIVEATTEKTKLTFFRGSESQLYGPTGASKEWLDEFIAGTKAEASS